MRNLLTVLGVLSLFLSSCSSIHNTYSEVNPNKNLYQYKTFAWIPSDSSDIQNPLYESQLTQKKVRNAVNAELVGRGFRFSPRNPDILVRYTLVLDEQQKMINYPYYSLSPLSPFDSRLPNFPNHPYDYSYANDQIYPYPYNPYGYYQYPQLPPLIQSYNYPYINFSRPNIYPHRPMITGNSFQQVEFEEGSVIIDLIDRNTKELIWRGWSQGTFTNPVEFKEQVDNVVRYIFERFPNMETTTLDNRNYQDNEFYQY